MRAVVVYESMYGNTHMIAEAIARGLAPGNQVTVVPVAGATRELLEEADLVVVGGPTHVHGMSKASTRKAAVEQSHKHEDQPALDANAEGPGLSDWFGSLGSLSAGAAAFDTRIASAAILTGRASKGIARLLERHGLVLIAPAESFLVSSDKLQAGEEDRAQKWGEELAAKVPVTRVRS